MTYVALGLAAVIVALALALVRVYGRLTTAEGKRAVAESENDALARDVAQLRAALSVAQSGRADEVERLRLALLNLRREFDRAAIDVVACQDPVKRRELLKDLAQRTEIVLGSKP